MSVYYVLCIWGIGLLLLLYGSGNLPVSARVRVNHVFLSLSVALFLHILAS